MDHAAIASIVIAGLGVARITALAVHDGITEPIREWVWRRSAPDLEHQLDGAWKGSEPVTVREPGFIGRLIACHHCVGVWVAVAAWAAIEWAPSAAWPVLVVAALAQISDTAITHSRG